MKVITYPLGELQANCSIIEHDGHCLIIDPGDSADFILEECMRQRLTIDGILLTHGHFDHCMATGEIQFSHGVENPIGLYLHEKDMFLLERLEETARHFLSHTPLIIIPKVTHFLKEGRHSVGIFDVNVLHTPGHTPGSCMFYFKDEQLLFTGDTFIKDERADTSHSYSSKKDLTVSLTKIKKLPLETIMYPGHGESVLLQEVISQL